MGRCSQRRPARGARTLGVEPLLAQGAPVVRQTDMAMSYRRRTHMYVVIRSYSGQGASALFDALAEREDDVRALISGVPGFTSYAAFRNDGGGQTVTVCRRQGRHR